MAAFQGDFVFQAPCRFLLEYTSRTQTAFAFRMFYLYLRYSQSFQCLLLVFKCGKATPDLGAFHSSNIPKFYGTGAAPDFIGTDALGEHFSNTSHLFQYQCPDIYCSTRTKAIMDYKLTTDGPLAIPIKGLVPQASSPI